MVPPRHLPMIMKTISFKRPFMQDALKRVLEEKRSLEKAQKRLAFLNDEILRVNRQLEKLARLVDQEYEEVEKLEGARLKAFIQKLKGEREELLEKEKQEYLDAVLQYNQAVKELELMEFERKVLLDKLLKRPEVEAKFKNELKKYEAQLQASDSRLGKELRNIDEKILAIHLKNKEYEEATHQGHNCLQTFWLIEQHLSKDFRTDDQPDHSFIPPGWNPIEYFSQIGRLEKARQKLPLAAKQLKLFIEELGDVYSRPEVFLGIKVKDFQRFSDYFFESYIADWKFRDRIAQLYKEITRIIKIMESTLNILKKEIAKGTEEIERLEDQKFSLIKYKLE